MTANNGISCGSLIIHQPDTGYRYNEDSLQLADFVGSLKKGGIMTDIGAGCGILALMLASRFPGTRFIAIEIQRELFNFLVRNIRVNTLEDRISAVHADITQIDRRYFGRIDAVITNPPFRESGTGRISPRHSKSIACHESTCNLDGLIAVSAKLLKQGGQLYIAYLPERLTALVTAMKTHEIEPKLARFIHPAPGKDASLVLVKGVRRGRPGMKIISPFFRRL